METLKTEAEEEQTQVMTLQGADFLRSRLCHLATN